MKNLKNSKIGMIIIEPYAGSHLRNVQKDAVILSVEEDTIVRFCFNDHWYQVNNEELLRNVIEDEKEEEEVKI
jgi:hypothetical protein